MMSTRINRLARMIQKVWLGLGVVALIVTLPQFAIADPDTAGHAYEDNAGDEPMFEGSIFPAEQLHRELAYQVAYQVGTDIVARLLGNDLSIADATQPRVFLREDFLADSGEFADILAANDGKDELHRFVEQMHVTFVNNRLADMLGAGKRLGIPGAQEPNPEMVELWLTKPQLRAALILLLTTSGKQAVMSSFFPRYSSAELAVEAMVNFNPEDASHQEMYRFFKQRIPDKNPDFADETPNQLRMLFRFENGTLKPAIDPHVLAGVSEAQAAAVDFPLDAELLFGRDSLVARGVEAVKAPIEKAFAAYSQQPWSERGMQLAMNATVSMDDLSAAPDIRYHGATPITQVMEDRPGTIFMQPVIWTRSGMNGSKEDQLGFHIHAGNGFAFACVGTQPYLAASDRGMTMPTMVEQDFFGTMALMPARPFARVMPAPRFKGPASRASSKSP